MQPAMNTTMTPRKLPIQTAMAAPTMPAIEANTYPPKMPMNEYQNVFFCD